MSNRLRHERHSVVVVIHAREPVRRFGTQRDRRNELGRAGATEQVLQREERFLRQRRAQEHGSKRRARKGRDSQQLSSHSCERLKSGPELSPPLADDVRLVDDERRQVAALSGGVGHRLKRLRQALRRREDDALCALRYPVLDRGTRTLGELSVICQLSREPLASREIFNTFEERSLLVDRQ